MSNDIETMERPEWPALPPERELPPDLRARTLHRAVDTRQSPARGRVWVPLAAAACAGLLVGGFLVVDGPGSSDDGPAPAEPPIEAPEDDFDLGALSGAELDRAIDTCTADWGADGAGSETHYARQVMAPVEQPGGKPSPALVFTTPGGKSFACFIPGLYDVSRIRPPQPSGPGDVAVALDQEFANGPSGGDLFVGRRHWLYGVGSDVAYIRTRLVVDGRPMPWQVGRPHDDGYVYVGLRYAATGEPVGKEFEGVVVETQVFAVDGQRIDDPDVPASDVFIPTGV